MFEHAAEATKRFAQDKGKSERKYDLLNPMEVPSLQQEYIWKKVKPMRNDTWDTLSCTLKQTKFATLVGKFFDCFMMPAQGT